MASARMRWFAVFLAASVAGLPARGSAQERVLISAPSPSFIRDSAGTAALRQALESGRAEAALRRLFSDEGYAPDLFRVVIWLPRDTTGWIRVMRDSDTSQMRWGERFVYVTVFTDDTTRFRDFGVTPQTCDKTKSHCGLDSIEVRRSTLGYERPALLSRALTLLGTAFGISAVKDDRRDGVLRDTTARIAFQDVGPLPKGGGKEVRHLFVAHAKFAVAEESRVRVSVRAPTPRHLPKVEGMTADFVNGSSVPFNVGLAVGTTFNAKVPTEVNADSGDVTRSGQEVRVGLYPFVVWYPLRELQPAPPWRTVGLGIIGGTSIKPSGVFEEFLVGLTLRVGLSGVHLLGAANFVPVAEAKQRQNGSYVKEVTREPRFMMGVGFEF